MADKYTKEQLNSFDKELLIQTILKQQAQVDELNDTVQKILEQVVLGQKHRFGRSSEKMEDVNQISFMEVDGNIVFHQFAAVRAVGEQQDCIALALDQEEDAGDGSRQAAADIDEIVHREDLVAAGEWLFAVCLSQNAAYF